MCVDKLVCKEKVLCRMSGTDVSVVFSMVGQINPTITILAILLKTSGTFTLRLCDQSGETVKLITKQGTGAFEFAVLSDLSLPCPNIYSLNATSTETIDLYELNMATRCLCDLSEC
jgi:hypothetical protein